MHGRLTTLGVIRTDGSTAPTIESTARLYAAFAKAGGDRRTSASLADEGRNILHQLRERGYDLGGAPEIDDEIPGAGHARIDAIYTHARLALYATLDDAVIRDAAPRHVRVGTMAVDREDYLAHPPRGERLSRDDVGVLRRLSASRRRPQVQIVISDGLNANAINQHLGALVGELRHLLAPAVHVGEVDIVIENGRVRAGYHAAELLDPEAIVHFIGERPGTGLNTVSAYLTYGRDAGGRFRWSPDLDHSCTTAVCGIHHRGKPPAVAVSEIARLIRRMLETRRSGVAMSD